jgi:hypothetical protein
MKVKLFVLKFLVLFFLVGNLASATDVTVPISSVANDNYAGVLPTFPTGTVVFAGVTFDLPDTCPYFDSNINSLPPDLSATQNVSLAGAQAVHLLLNTANTYSSQMSVGQQVGQVVLDFSGGGTSVTPLLVGVNIREWAIGTTAQSVITNYSDPNLQNIWQGLNNGGILSAIDMLTIPVTNSGSLVQIIVQDQSIALIGQTNPALNWRATTVTIPEPDALLLVLVGFGILVLARRCQCRTLVGTIGVGNPVNARPLDVA